NLIDSVISERHALSWITVGVQTKVIVHTNAVNSQAVETWVSTTTLDAVTIRFINVDTWVNTHDVFDVTVDCWRFLQITQAKVTCWASTTVVVVQHCSTSNRDTLNVAF